MRIVSALFFSATVLALAQPVAFEVAAIKPTDPAEVGRMGTGMFTYPGGRVLVHNCSVSYIALQAFDEQKILYPNAPSWWNDERFEVDAKPPADSKASKSTPFSIKLPPNAEQREMLQTLLAERFQLKYHRETKEENVYLLTAGKSLKLQESTDPKMYPWAGSFGGGAFSGDGIAGMNITMEQLSRRLTQVMGRPVLDRTGLTAAFDFKYRYASDGDRPDLVSALIASLDALGLKIQAAKAPMEIIVIDHVERPSPN